MNNLIIAQNYNTFGDEGLTSNKVIYYKDDNMVKFRANISDKPFGESEVVTVGGSESYYTLDAATNVLKKMDVVDSIQLYDYLQGDSLAYIDTNYRIDYYDSIKTKLSVTQSIQNRMVFMGWFSANQNSVSSGFGFSTGAVNSRWFNRKVALMRMNLNTIYEFTFNKDGYKGDINMPFDEELDVPTNTKISGTMTLVRLASMSDSYSKGKVKLYYTQIFNKEGKLIKDFRPCLYNDEAGLWELVENKFYGNANSTGTLTVGNDE